MTEFWDLYCSKYSGGNHTRRLRRFIEFNSTVHKFETVLKSSSPVLFRFWFIGNHYDVRSNLKCYLCSKLLCKSIFVVNQMFQGFVKVRYTAYYGNFVKISYGIDILRLRESFRFHFIFTTAWFVSLNGNKFTCWKRWELYF